VGDADVISTFWFSTSCRILVHELGRDKLNTTKELLYIATRHASGDEAVGVVFVLGNGKMVLDSSRAHHQKPPAWAPRAAERDKSDTLGGLLSLLAAMTTIRTRNVSDEEYVMVVECDFKCHARHGNQKSISRSFSKRPVRTIRTTSSTSSKIVP
jgi:hypothetical protein